MDAKVYLRANAMLGEGPLWDDRTNTLYFVDIEGKKLNRVVNGALESFEMPSRIGTVGMTDQDDLIVALEDGLHFFDPESRKLTLFVDPDSTPGNRGNDGKPGPDGNMWADIMPMVRGQTGGLYRVTPDGECICIMDGLGCANGMGWSPDHKTMYFIDSPSKVVWAFDFDEKNGEVSNQRVVVDMTGEPQENGVPDGMTVDAEGKLWVARFGGRCVKRYDNITGQLLMQVDVPAMAPSCPVFGGENLDKLYITTAGFDKEESPDAGCVFVADVGVKGMKAFRFHKK